MKFSTAIPIASLAAASAAVIQHPNLEQSALALERQLAVREVIEESYAAYRKYAYGYDQLQPYTLNGTQTRNGWGATIFDSLSLLQITGFEDWYYEAVRWVGQQDFRYSQTNDTVSVFETTIRYLAGMLSAYELSPTKDEVLLEKAKQLGESLTIAWANGSHPIPYNDLNLLPGNRDPVIGTTNIAQAGTLTLEFDTLSHFIGNDTYRQLAAEAVKAVMAAPAPLPGLPAQVIDPSNSQPVDDYVTWGGGSDSYFEYLNKYALLTGNEDPAYIAAWSLAVDSSIHDLIRYSSVKNLTYSADYTKSGGGLQFIYSHLACFQGGNWLLGGKMLQNETIVDVALRLIDTCHNSYVSTATHIGPEAFGFVDAETGSHRGWDPSAEDLAFYNAHGMGIISADYIQRPEVVESYFYAYRVTGDTKYQDWAWDAFTSIRKYLKATVAWGSTLDVNTIPPPPYNDMETFWFGELMKYFYLIFAPSDVISLDEWVFNTEAQPFRIRKEGVFAPVQEGHMPTPTGPFVFNAATGPLPVASGAAQLVADGILKKAPVASDAAKTHKQRRNHAKVF